MNKANQINIHGRALGQINRHLVFVKGNEKQSPEDNNIFPLLTDFKQGACAITPGESQKELHDADLYDN